MPCQSKITELGGPIFVQQDVWWFQVSMQDPMGMKIVEGRGQFEGELLGLGFPEGSLLG
jgi:hypothetical protein